MASSFEIRALQKAHDAMGKELSEIGVQILSHSIVSYEQYSQLRGKYFGIKRAIEILEDVEKEIK
jgi:hypothetical protein